MQEQYRPPSERAFDVVERVVWLVRAVSACQALDGERLPVSAFGVGLRKQRDDERRVGREIERLVEHDMVSVEMGFESDGWYRL